MIISEFGSALGIAPLKNRYIATLIAVGPAVPLVLAGKNAWGPLWILFGTTNQLIGAMTLLVVFVYLLKSKRPLLPIALPMIFLIMMTTGAMVLNLVKWIADGDMNPLTIGMGSIILMLEIWMIIEAIIIVLKYKNMQLNPTQP